MTDKEYKKLIESQPKPIGELDWWYWMISNNSVVHTTLNWVGIENVKYHTDSHPHYTFFYRGKSKKMNNILMSMATVLQHYPDYTMYINKLSDRTVEVFHFHLTKRVISDLFE